MLFATKSIHCFTFPHTNSYISRFVHADGSCLCDFFRLSAKGRIKLLSGLSIVVVGLILLTVSTVLSDSVSEMAYVSVVALMITIIGIGVGPMLLLTAYPSEVTTQVTRPNALWLGTAIFWITGTIVAFVFPYSQRAIGGYAYIPFVILVLIEVSLSTVTAFQQKSPNHLN